MLNSIKYTVLNVVFRHLPRENERNFFRFGVFLNLFPSATSSLDSSLLLFDIIRIKLMGMPLENVFNWIFPVPNSGELEPVPMANRNKFYPTLCISQIIHFHFNEIADGNILLFGSQNSQISFSGTPTG